MNELRPSRSFRRLLAITAGLCFAALAALSLAGWHVDPVPEPPEPAPFTPDALPVKESAPEPSSEPLRESEVMTRPVPLETPRPRYTKSARRAGIHGTVIMEVVINEKGRVTDTRVLRSLPMGLDRMAVEAVRSWRFQPATLNGKPVKVYHSLVVEFDLKR